MVISGKDAGTESRIAKVFPDANRIIVEGVATAKRHQKPTGETEHRRHHRQGHADRRLERDDRLQGLRTDEDRLRPSTRTERSTACAASVESDL